MILWTFQHSIVLDILKTDGVFRAEWKYTDKHLRPCYLWIATQMKKRLGHAPHADSAPIWCWYQWRGRERPKPDLRYWRHLFQGTKGIRLEFETEEANVLLADFDLYENCTLFKQYLPQSEADWNQFQKKAQKYNYEPYIAYQHSHLRKEIERSWERLFDLDWHLDCRELLVFPKEKKSIMGLMWELRWEQIRKVEWYNYV